MLSARERINTINWGLGNPKNELNSFITSNVINYETGMCLDKKSYLAKQRSKPLSLFISLSILNPGKNYWQYSLVGSQ